MRKYVVERMIADKGERDYSLVGNEDCNLPLWMLYTDLDYFSKVLSDFWWSENDKYFYKITFGPKAFLLPMEPAHIYTHIIETVQ